MPEKKLGKGRGKSGRILLYALGAVLLHGLLLFPVASLIYRGSLRGEHSLLLQGICAAVSCAAMSAWQGRGEANGALLRAGALALGYAGWLILLSALMNGGIMDNSVTPVVCCAGLGGSLAGQVTKLCKSNKSYKNGIKTRKNITNRYRA